MNKLEENNSRVSITLEMLRHIAFYYLTVTILLTITQVYFEYKNIKTSIDETNSNLFKSFNKSLTNSIWEFNENQTLSILTGISESPTVLGVRLITTKTKDIWRKNKTYLKNFEKKNLGLFNPNKIFEYKYKLIKKREGNKAEQVGTLIIFSGNPIVLDQLSNTIFYILIKAVVNTFFLWIILLIILQKKVKQPLNSLIEKIRLTDPQKPKIIELNKTDTETEEIFLILTSFNSMIKELANFKDVLEAIVENKTERLKETNIEVRNLVSKLENAQDQIIKQEKIHGLSLAAAGLAHDLREPLNLSSHTIKSLENLLSNCEPTHLSKEEINTIMAEMSVLTETNSKVESTLKNMVLQTNPIYSKPGQVNLKNVVESNYKRAFVAKENDFIKTIIHKIEIKDNLTLEIFPNEFKRLLFNLYENAFDALESKDHKVSKLDKSYRPEIFTSAKKYGKDKILFTIHDNGIGISDEIKDGIFDPFSSNKINKMTTGLGLYIVPEVIKKHGGELSVNSEVNIYTEFRIVLPIKLG